MNWLEMKLQPFIEKKKREQDFVNKRSIQQITFIWIQKSK